MEFKNSIRIISKMSKANSKRKKISYVKGVYELIHPAVEERCLVVRIPLQIEKILLIFLIEYFGICYKDFG